MGRPVKKEINLTKESILSLNMTVLGPIIKEQQKIINDCVEKKLSLSKLQSSIWEKSNSTQEAFSLSDLDVDDTILTNLIQKDVSKTDEPYKMKK